MGQPVKLSDGLINEARNAGIRSQRSLAGQIEYWARLGRSIEPILEGRKLMELASAPLAEPKPPITAESIDAALRSVDTPAGRERVFAYLRSEPFPHFEPHPSRRGLLNRVEADGTITAGRFHGREFRPHRARRPKS